MERERKEQHEELENDCEWNLSASDHNVDNAVGVSDSGRLTQPTTESNLSLRDNRGQLISRTLSRMGRMDSKRRAA
jgi:hypothetical protein